MSNKLELFEKYDSLLSKGRENLSQMTSKLMNSSKSRDHWVFFLAAYYSQGVFMTEKVPEWISEAAKRAIALGDEKLGKILMRHAAQESNHHLMYQNDLKILKENFKDLILPKLDEIAKLESNIVFESVANYSKLHELNIKSETPLLQIAIEYEVELISLMIGPNFISFIEKTFGRESEFFLTFIKEHVLFDQGHTEFNKKLLNSLFTAHPKYIDKSVEIGERALVIFGDYINECWEFASRMLE